MLILTTHDIDTIHVKKCQFIMTSAFGTSAFTSAFGGTNKAHATFMPGAPRSGVQRFLTHANTDSHVENST